MENYHIGFSQQVKQENGKTLNLGFVMHTARSNSVSQKSAKLGGQATQSVSVRPGGDSGEC